MLWPNYVHLHFFLKLLQFVEAVPFEAQLPELRQGLGTGWVRRHSRGTAERVDYGDELLVSVAAVVVQWTIDFRNRSALITAITI